MPDTAEEHIEDALRERVDALERKVERLTRTLKRQTKGQSLRPVRALAEQNNAYPDTYDGLIKLMKRRGVPKRLASGAKKPKGSRAQTFVSLTELEAGQELATQSVQRDADLL